MPKWLKTYLSGVLMGAADVVPGVSGGTIAFIVGIYDRLIHALSGVNKVSVIMLFKGDIKGLWQHFDLGFLLVLAAGILTSIVSLAGIITHALSDYPIWVWSFFFGLILASAWMLAKEFNLYIRKNVLSLFVGVVVGASLSMLVPMHISLSLSLVFFAGMIAICAMILPGISGSFLLLMMGLYGDILLSIKEFNIVVIAVFGCGALVGLLSFSKLLNWTLNRYRELSMAMLTGVMLGALVKVWPWKEVTDVMVVGDKQVPVSEALLLPWNLEHYSMFGDFLGPLCVLLLGLFSVFIVRFASNRIN
ncbi:DUF368 domain-containing protein [Marinomonas mediterranea]|jgi:Predicted membrane protein|uniref:DUF368 domain-containing protein n=1 Tax=Marinomonas mediterranea (strain ATCC 700492 / JCM 21426 / NBRC 103028 / MMB-1) TaxID=717774 RepID=F2JUP0_MARM1|nr:DUF368 domain-containing protein [Marinomonas mediterranea]ADZ90455.1 protein of unknown function DUF368 [Marinomonas mediterranea MMB-1]WCN12566.1 DUF368 domain-containing protein [Marinomonas mediterranea]WCN16637.1 DUF368 domain-containing protein [Marinomonas mediterranea MMB-1]